MRRRLLLALGLSLGLHVLVLALLLRLPREASRAIPPRPLAVEIVELPRTAGTRATERRAGPGRTAGAPPVQAAAPSPPPAHPVRPGGDAPLAPPNLFPEGALAVAVPEVAGTELADAGPPEAVLARRIQTWRLSNLAEQRVAAGVDSYFSTLAHALRDGLGTPPPAGSPRAGTPSGAQRWIQGWLAALEAAEAPPDPAPPGEPLPQMNQHDVSGREGELIRRLLGPMAPTQTSLIQPFELFRKTQVPPAAVLRIEQDAEGHVVHADLVASSGDSGFDAWVKRSALLALAAVPRPPAQGAGIHPEGTRSEWAFWRQGDGVSVVLLRVY
ncbi:MAG TPA: hypothetical protein VEJ89_00490, partial [Myxococcaceae bacterium]|nr:hypothetical protein [Myxococcaceae bacterium]